MGDVSEGAGREEKLRPGRWQRAFPLFYVVMFSGQVTSPATGIVEVGFRILAAVIAVSGLAFSLVLQFSWISVGSEGIAHHTWRRTKRWRWDEISGFGQRTLRPRLWVFRPTGGSWQQLVPWLPLPYNVGRRYQDAFIDAAEQAAIEAGITPVQVSFPSDGSLLARASTYLGVAVSPLPNQEPRRLWGRKRDR